MRFKNSHVIFGWILLLALMAAAGIRSPAQERGEKPSAAELVRKAIEQKGIVTAKEEFAKILNNKDGYVFEESEFLALGNEYLKAGKPDTAAAVIALAAEAFPGSVAVLRLLAHSYYISGDEEKSLKVQAKMMSVRGKAELADFLEKNKNSLAKTAEDVIARSLKATGRRKAWKVVKTMVVVFSIQSTAGEQTRMVRRKSKNLEYRGVDISSLPIGEGLFPSPGDNVPPEVEPDDLRCFRVIIPQRPRQGDGSLIIKLTAMADPFAYGRIDGVRIFMESVETEFVPHPEHDEQAGGHPHSQAGDVDKSKTFVPLATSPGDDKVIFKHLPAPKKRIF